jgi:hypothetical protein
MLDHTSWIRRIVSIAKFDPSCAEHCHYKVEESEIVNKCNCITVYTYK